jgi:hypothetical protein
VKLFRLGLASLLCVMTVVLGSARSHAQDFTSQNRADHSEDPFLAPHRHQFDLLADDTYSFVDPSSVVRRANTRRTNVPTSAIHLSGDLGLSTLQLPATTMNFWFDNVNAIEFQARYYANYGSSFSTAPLFFNGDKILPNQNLSTGGTRWFAFDLLYERRLTPLFEGRDGHLPVFLQSWDVRAKFGLEFVYLDFRINDGKPNFQGFFLTRGRFHERELPMPTLALEARRVIAGPFKIAITAQGNWANKWNSFRSDGGTVDLSQAAFDTHWRIFYDDPDHLRGVRPFIGANYSYFKMVANSSVVKDFIRAEMYGPEFGLTVSF